MPLKRPAFLASGQSDSECSHEGDACTVESPIARFDLTDSGLRTIAEFVHDVDLKEFRFGRPQNARLRRLDSRDMSPLQH